jgi:hypothetical protein
VHSAHLTPLDIHSPANDSTTKLTVQTQGGGTTVEVVTHPPSTSSAAKPPEITIETTSAIAEADLTWQGKAGKIIALIFAIGTGVTAMAALTVLVSGPAFFILAPLLCVATTYANYRMTKNDVANILLGGIKGLFTYDLADEAHKDAEGHDTRKLIPLHKRIFLAVGILFSLTFGVALGALTFNATLALTATFPFLTAVSVLLPPIGILLGIDTFFCLFSLMVKAFSELAKTDNLLQKIKHGFVDMFWFNAERDAGKPTWQVVLERGLVAIAATTMVVATLGLIMWGKINTLMNCANAFADILMKIPHASAVAVNVVSNILVNVCALIAQIPFVLKTALTPIFMLFAAPLPKSIQEDIGEVKPMTTKKKFETTALFTASIFSSGAMAAIAMSHKVLNAFTVLAGVGAFLDGVTSNTVNALLSAREKVVVTKKIQTSIGNSTVKIHVDLGTPVSSPKFTKVTTPDPVSPPSPTRLDQEMSVSSASNVQSVPSSGLHYASRRSLG